MFRRIARLIFVLSIVLALGSVGLWVRTYPFGKDVLSLQGPRHEVTFNSKEGALTTVWEPARPDKYHQPKFTSRWLRVYGNEIPFPDPWDVDAEGYHDNVIYNPTWNAAAVEWQTGFTIRQFSRRAGAAQQPAEIITPTNRYALKVPYWMPAFAGVVLILITGRAAFGRSKKVKSAPV